jgi:signal peptidase I
MADPKKRKTGSGEPQAPTDETPFDPSGLPKRSAAGVIAAWFFSRTMRHAVSMRRHVQKLLNHQRDILSPQAVEALQTAIHDINRVIGVKTGRGEISRQMELLEKAANKWLKPYPSAAWRENVEVLLVALGVAMGIRTFFLQPFKIPTGSMQPSLFGVTSQNLLAEDASAKVPEGMERVRDWFKGISYLRVYSKVDGELQTVRPPVRFLIFSIKQTLYIGGVAHTIWFPPDYGSSSLEQRAGLRYGEMCRKGQEIARLKISAGDHLFVDRMTYNFRPPSRGEIIVFETRGIPAEQRDASMIPGDQFYIKRLVGLGGERLQLGEDRHLIVDGRRLDASDPHFEQLYSFDPKSPPRDSHYSGHVNASYLAAFFQNRSEGVTIPGKDLMVMGDNTMNSLDSRAWGTFPAEYVIGKAFFVYWPLTDRFGCGYNR